MEATTLNTIPMPKEVIGADDNGKFEYVSFKATISASENVQIYADSFCNIVKKVHGITVEYGEGGIVIALDRLLGKGMYRLTVNDTINITAGDTDGINYALATLVQLMTPECTVPKVEISDSPDCEYRSFMLDIARQWHDFEVLLKYVDLCYLYKVKFLHLHFIDDQSYTLPSKILPRLSTEGRHYTFEQIKQLNEYAFARGIEIIPEIETPGHSKAIIAAYPDIFGCELTEGAEPPKYENIMCVGKPGIMEALNDLVDEIIEMFPNSRYLHIGGDEAKIERWNKCPYCIEYMRENGIDGEKALYTHFIKLMTNLVLSKGITPIVWEGFPKEGAEQLSRDILVVAWESYYHFANELVEEGFNIVNGSWKPMYITPTAGWIPQEIMAWSIYDWYHFWVKSEARLNPIHLPKTPQVKGGIFLSWECNYEQEQPRVKKNLAALSARTWNIRRYEDDELFMNKLEYVLTLADKLI